MLRFRIGLATTVACLVAASGYAAQNDLATRLGSSNRTEQLAALQSAIDLGAKAEPFVSSIVPLLETKDEEVRLYASMALGRIGARAIDPTVALLKSPNEGTRFYAAWTLAWMGPEAKSTTKALADALGDSNAGVRRKAAFALGRIKPDQPEIAVAALAKALDDADSDVRQAAGDALPDFGTAALPALTAALQRAASDEGKIAAIKSLAKLGGAAGPAMPLVGKAFRSMKTLGNMIVVADELARLGKPALAEFAEALKVGGSELCVATVHGLHAMNPDGAPALVDALGDKRREVRFQAAQALGSMNLPEKVVVIGLSYAAKQDADPDVRVAALSSLGNLGVGAKLGLPAVESCLVDLDPRVRQTAFFALARLGANPRESLTKALQSGDDRVRIPIAGLMLKQDMEPEEALKVLSEALKHDKRDMRLAAAAALADAPGRVSPETSALVVEALAKAMKEDDVAMKVQAARALGQLGKAAFPVLSESLKSAKDPGLQAALLRGLRSRGFHDPEAVPALVQCLSSTSAEVRWQSAFILGNIGPDAKTAIEPLQSLRNDPNPTVQLYANNALKRIQR